MDKRLKKILKIVSDKIVKKIKEQKMPCWVTGEYAMGWREACDEILKRLK